MIGLIVARSKNNCIGKNGKIPWKIKGEQKQFKELTTGNVVVMGRNSYDEIGHPLPNREAYMGSGAIKWHVHCSVCGAFIEKSAQSDSEVECKKCRSTLEIFVKDDMVSVRPIHIRDEQLKSRMRTYSRKMMNQGS